MRHMIGRIGVDFISHTAALDLIRGWMRESSQRTITTPNPEMVMMAEHDDAFAAVHAQADLSIADGAGLVWAARRLYGAKREYPRLAGVDLMQAICETAALEGWRIFLLGGTGTVTQRCQEVLEARFPGLQVCGQNTDLYSSASAASIHSAIASCGRVDMLFVAYGAPKQETWIVQHLSSLPQVHVAMGVGGSFDYIAGSQKRAPVWMRHIGLEWLFRLMREPWRLKRMLALPRFMLLVLKEQRKKSTMGQSPKKELSK